MEGVLGPTLNLCERARWCLAHPGRSYPTNVGIRGVLERAAVSDGERVVAPAGVLHRRPDGPAVTILTTDPHPEWDIVRTIVQLEISIDWAAISAEADFEAVAVL